VGQGRTHDYTRHWTTNLYGALEVASGKVISQLTVRHRATKFKRFLAHLDRSVPVDLAVYVTCDNSSRRNSGWNCVPSRRWPRPRPLGRDRPGDRL